MSLEVNITARAQTEEDLAAAMRKAVDQCHLGWNRGQGKSEDGSAEYEFTLKGYEDSTVIVATFSIKSLI